MAARATHGNRRRSVQENKDGALLRLVCDGYGFAILAVYADVTARRRVCVHAPSGGVRGDFACGNADRDNPVKAGTVENSVYSRRGWGRLAEVRLAQPAYAPAVSTPMPLTDVSAVKALNVGFHAGT